MMQEDPVWELFHENSKQTHYDQHLTDYETFLWMKQIDESLSFPDYPVLDLSQHILPLECSLRDAVLKRYSSRNIENRAVSLGELATVLHYAYGTTGRVISPDYPRTLRTVPSAGALYPIDLFLFANNVESLEVGMYHYCPIKQGLHPLNRKDQKQRIAEALVQRDIFAEAPVFLFLVANFGRTVFKYGNRGYRFVFLDAGHLAQNVNLVATGLGLASCNLGGYYDNIIDEALGLDGISQSTIYAIVIGYDDQGISPTEI